MDSFEKIVSQLLEKQGFWIKTSFKVNLSKEEKRAIGRPSSPRWELDLVAYKARINVVNVIECKSFLDSPGVRFVGFEGDNEIEKNRYKLFNDEILRNVIFNRLQKQLEDSGLCSSNPKIRLGLATGKIASDIDRKQIEKLFARNDWLLYDDFWIREKLKMMSSEKYENEIAPVVAKILLR